MMQCDAVCCSALQCFAPFCSKSYMGHDSCVPVTWHLRYVGHDLFLPINFQPSPPVCTPTFPLSISYPKCDSTTHPPFSFSISPSLSLLFSRIQFCSLSLSLFLARSLSLLLSFSRALPLFLSLALSLSQPPPLHLNHFYAFLVFLDLEGLDLLPSLPPPPPSLSLPPTAALPPPLTPPPPPPSFPANLLACSRAAFRNDDGNNTFVRVCMCACVRVCVCVCVCVACE